MRVGVEKLPVSIVDFEEGNMEGHEVKVPFDYDHTSEMVKNIEEEEGRYDCRPDKGHMA